MKRLIAFILAVIMICVLCGCGQRESVVPVEEAQPSPAETAAEMPTEELTENAGKKLGVVFCGMKPDEENLESYCLDAGVEFQSYSEYYCCSCNEPDEFVVRLFGGDIDDCTDVIIIVCDTNTENPYTLLFDTLEIQSAFPEKSFLIVCVENAQIDEPEPIIEASYKLLYSRFHEECNFSEGFAWAAYSGGSGWGVIDENGYIVFELPSDVRFQKVTRFNAGISCLYNVSGIDAVEKGVWIIDTEGNVLFRSNDYPDSEFYFLGSGDGTVLLLEHTQGFSDSTWNVCEWNRSGITHRSECTYYAPEHLRIAKYYGEGIFVQSNENASVNYAYSVRSHQYLDIEISPPRCDFYDGIAVLGQNIITPDCFDSVDALSRYLELPASDELAIFGSFGELEFSDGVCFADCDDQGYYNYHGELVVDIPDEWEVLDAGKFSGGYAVLFLRGADGNKYVTTIDAQGNMMYEPRKSASKKYKPQAWCGYIELDGVLYGPDGNTVEYIPYEIAQGQKTTSEKDEFCDGFKWCSDLYDNDANYYKSFRPDVEDIHYAIKVSNYDEIKDLPVQKTETEISQSATEIPAKTYVSLSSFSIEGKWKSVGSYGFGQAQPGAIVVFDGNNCNFFSPKDTYAFSKDGDNYKLECTSFMSTDTLTFTVKTIDEDNIDVYYGDNVTELTRVG